MPPAKPHADQVVEIPVRKPLDIQIDGRAFELQFGAADDVDFLLPNRQRLQRVVILLPFVAQFFGSATGPERVRELGDGENAFTVELRALFLGHVRQQTEIVLLHRLLLATGLEFARSAVTVQNEVGRLRIGQQRGDFLDSLSHLACHGRGLHLQRGVVVAVDDADADFTSQRFREREGIEGQQQFVVLAQLVGEEEANRDELSRLPSVFGGHAFDRVEFGFQDTGIHLRLHRQAGGQPPLGTFDILHVWREHDLVFRRLGIRGGLSYAKIEEELGMSKQVADKLAHAALNVVRGKLETLSAS